MSPQKTEFNAVRLELLELTVLEMEQHLTEPQVARLKELVCNDPDACKYYVSLQYDKIFLNEIATSIDLVFDRTDTDADEAPSASADQTLLTAAIFNRISKPVAVGLAGGILFVLTIIGALQLVAINPQLLSSKPDFSSGKNGQPTTSGNAFKGTSQGISFANLTGTKDAVWANADHPQTPPSKLVPGQHLNLDSGLIEIQFNTGARVVLAGPAELVLGGKNQGSNKPWISGFLKRGRLVAHVSAPAVGFTIQTPTAVVTDLGTQFGIQIDTNGGMNLGVLTGAVEWGQLGTIQRSRVTSGQEVMVNDDGAVVGSSNLFAGQFVALVEQQLNVDFNESAVDPLQAVEFARSNKGRSYRVISGGVKAGAKIFSDREYRLDDVDFQEFPKALEDLDLIQLDNEEKNNPDLTIAVKFQHAGSLYLFQRKIQDAPNWLVEKFQSTPHEVALKSLGTVYEYKVWERQMDKGETILLESAFVNTDHGMYGLAAKRLSP